MVAEVRYISGPNVVHERGELRGEAVMWVQVGTSDKFRPVRLTNEDLVHLAMNCLQIVNRRMRTK